MTTAVAKTKATTSALVALADLQAESGAGTEEIGGDDTALPYLSIVQKQGGWVDKDHENYLPEATVGMFVNTISHELRSGEEGVVVIPCYFRQVWIETTAGKRGRFVAEHPAGTELALQTHRNADGQDELPDGHVLIRTARHFCLLAETGEPVIITMRSTQLRASKRWNSLVTGRKIEDADGNFFRPPSFASVWRLHTVLQSNDEGSWYGFKVEIEGDLTDLELFAEARAFSQLCKGGHVSAAVESEEG